MERVVAALLLALAAACAVRALVPSPSHEPEVRSAARASDPDPPDGTDLLRFTPDERADRARRGEGKQQRSDDAFHGGSGERPPYSRAPRGTGHAAHAESRHAAYAESRHAAYAA